jgi:hypothetical protein
MILSEPKDWTSDNRKQLQVFLESDTGQLALAWLASRAPELLDGTCVNRTLVASGCVKGYNKALTELVSLTREQPTEVLPPLEYPDLDDDSKWDGPHPK